MLAAIKSTIHRVVPNKNVMTINTAKQAGEIAAIVTALREHGVTQERVDELTRADCLLTDMLGKLENMIKKTREKGDVHILRVIQDLKRTQARNLQFVDEMLRPYDDIVRH